MTSILGISAFYHDSAACLLVDGKVAAAAHEERFTRKKHDSGFPVSAIRYVMEQADLTPEQLDHVIFYEKPLLRFDRFLETMAATAPLGLRMFISGLGSFTDGKLGVAGRVDRCFEQRYEGPVWYCRHHDSHAASAFFPSPFESAAILTVDGVGEWTSTSICHGRGNRITPLKEIRFPHSLGLLYSAFTYYTGFKVNSGEYKLMGLAPFGQPRFKDLILKELVELHEDGSFRLNLACFPYQKQMRMINRRFEDLMGGPTRHPDDPILERHMDVAASIQAVTEEIMMRLAREAHRLTGEKYLCLAGGVALNCVANGRILREGPFEDLWIQPASGDAGGSLGAAFHAWHSVLGNPRDAGPGDKMESSLLGPAFGDQEIRSQLERLGAVFHPTDEQALLEKTVDLLEESKVVGWFQGRMEFGPRALGNRTILADPRQPAMQSWVNRKIKFREGFRPFAPVVMEEKVHEVFELDRPSPYMLLVSHVREEHRRPVNLEHLAPDDWAERLKQARSTVAAITHVDYSARIQTCAAEGNPLLHRLLEHWEGRTGLPVLLNTSFNVRGEPIVCTPEDGYRCFMRTNMDALVMGSFILYKEEQPQPENPAGEWFPPD